jgi:hypothetical protein
MPPCRSNFSTLTVDFGLHENFHKSNFFTCNHHIAYSTTPSSSILILGSYTFVSTALRSLWRNISTSYPLPVELTKRRSFGTAMSLARYVELRYFFLLPDATQDDNHRCGPPEYRACEYHASKPLLRLSLLPSTLTST